MVTASRPLLYLLDGHALSYRHFFATSKGGRNLTSPTGEPTGAVFGFTRGLMDVLEKDRPDYLAVTFDDGLSGRETLYPAYKGHREEMPNDLSTQIARIQQVVQAFDIPVLMVSGTEADDVMGTIARQAEEQGLDVRIFTGDRDLLQLLSEHVTVRVFIPMAGVPDEVYDVAKFRDKYGLDPLQLIDLKALQGDSSDNIPGVAGVGEKTAKALLQEYGTVEGIYANIDEIKGATQKKLIAGRESAYLSKQLATIRRDIPIDLDAAKCTGHLSFDKTKVEAIFRELNFKSAFDQLNRITKTADAAAKSGGQMSLFDLSETVEQKIAPTIFPTVIVQDADALRDLVAKLESATTIAFDTETTSTDQMAAGLVGISLSVDGETGYYIPVGHLEGEQLPLDTVLEALRPALTDPKIGKVAHNAVYDLVVLRQVGLDVTPITFDTMVAEWVLDPLQSPNDLGLKRMAYQKLGINMTPITELIGTGKHQTTMDNVPISSAASYAAADAVVTYKLIDKVRADLENETPVGVDPLWGTPNPPTPLDVLHQIEMPLVPVIASMEERGVLLDVPFLREMGERMGAQLAALEEEIYALSGGYGRFNINSPKQLNDVLFGKLGLPSTGLKKTTHGFSVDASVLDNLRGEHPIIDKILEYRQLTKLKGTYVDALPALINPRTGRVHTSFNQTGASTGRMSSSNPNLQNIPIRSEMGREIRKGFIVPPGYKLLSVDYSQVELRILAHLTGDAFLIDSFRQGLDIHAATAAVVAGVPIEQVTKTQRIFAKRVNFGVLYGMSAFRLTRESGLPLAEAQKFIDNYFERLPNVQAYIKNTVALAKENYLSTLFGRRRRFPGLSAGNRNERMAAEREAINMPIQGTAADIIKKAMITLEREIAARGLGARMLLQVHDELVFEVPESELHDSAALIVETMEGVIDLRAPLKANASAGDNWLDVEELG